MSNEYNNQDNQYNNNNHGTSSNGGGEVGPESTTLPPTALSVKSDAQSTSHHPPQELLFRHRPFPFPASLLQERSLKRARTVALQQLAQVHVDPPAHICGLEVPTKTIGACGACGRTEEDPSNAIVLCDGEGCGQEFHMNCCTPPLLTVPKGAFYCIDCCDKGSTKQLEEYFVQHAQRKEEHERWLLRSAKKRKVVPVSFVDALLMEDVVRESKEADAAASSSQDKLAESTSTKKSRSQTSRSQAAAGPVYDENLLVPCSELEQYYTKDRYQELIGKPVRMYCPIGNNYHNGRIINAHRYHHDDDEENGPISYLVRFPRGKDQRKTSLTLWMDLEEHSLAVATDILWVCFGNPDGGDASKKKSTSSASSKHGKGMPKWTQAKLWRRNARELIPVADSLLADKQQIIYRKMGPKPAAIGADKSTNATTEAPLKPTLQWGLFESFGPPGFYQLLEFETCTKSENPLVAAMPAGQPTISVSKSEQAKNVIIQGLVNVEQSEQKRVEQWNALPLHNPLHVNGIKCQDEMALGPLYYQTPITKACFPTTTLVDDGLDRLAIMEIVAENLKIAPSKDLSMDMVCEIVESLPATVQSITVQDVASTKFGGKL